MMNAGNLNGKTRRISDRRRRLIAFVSALSLLISSCGLTAFAEQDGNIYSAPVTAPAPADNTSPEPEEGNAEATPAPEGQTETGAEPQKVTEGEPETAGEPEDLTVYEAGTLTAETDGVGITVDYTAEARVPEGAVLTLTRAAGGDLYSAMKSAARVLKTEDDGTWKSELGEEAVFYKLALTDPEGNEIHPEAGVTLSCENLAIPAGATGFVTGSKADNLDWEGTLTVDFLPEAIGYAYIRQVQTGTVTLTHKGSDYTVTASYGPEAAFPAGTELKVREIRPGTAEYALYSGMTDEALNEDWAEITLERYFDITFVAGGEELEPQGDVDVQIAFRNKIEQNEETEVAAVHIENNEATVIESDTESNGSAAHDEEAIDTVTFTSDSFSVYGVVQKKKITKKILAADGLTYEINVTYGPETGIPEEAQLKVEEILSTSELYEEYVSKAEDALGRSEGSTDYIRLFDIKIVDQNDDSVKYQPAEGTTVDVHIGLADAEDEELSVVHFESENSSGEVVDAETDGQSVEFEADGFSVYAVFGGEDPNARIKVNFHAYDEQGNEKVTTMFVKESDTAEALEMILFDPGVGKLGEGEMFRGWTQNQNYTAAQATSAYDATSNPNGAMTIEDVREWAKALQTAGIVETNPITEYHFYPMIVKSYSITYLDRFGVSIDTDSAYMLRNESTAHFTINMNYETNDEDYHFKGWVSNDEDKITLDVPAPELEQVTILVDPDYTDNPYNLYKNNTKVTVSGNVTFKAHAPKGKWLIFHEVEKGATYVAPQFLEEGDTADMPDPDDMYLLGYKFAGWYKGDPIYGEDGVTVIGATPNYNANHKYNGEAINQKTHVYAKWEPATLAPYTVIIWRQNLDGTYAYAESVKLAGEVDANIQNLGHLIIENNNDADYLRIQGQKLNAAQTALENYSKTYKIVHRRTGGGSTNNPYVHHYYTEGTTTESPYVGFNCASIEYQDETIKPEGTSIVNVYYDRITYTIRIYYAIQNTRTGEYYVANNRNNEATNPIGSGNNFGMSLINGAIQWHREGNGWASGYYSNPVNPQSVVDGNNRYYYTTITAKYGENIASQWPKYTSFPDLDTDNNHNGSGDSSGYLAFVSWYMMNDAAGYRGSGSGLNTFKGVISKMDEKLLGDITRGGDGVNVLFGRYDTRKINIYTYKIWKEALLDNNGDPIIPAGKESRVGPDGLTYYLDESIQANSNAQPSGTQAPNYIGFENFQTDKPADNNQSGRREDIVCWYHRVKNPIIYRDGAYFDGNGNRLNAYPPHGQDQESDPIPYETNLESYNGGYNAAGELIHGDNYKMDYPSSYDGFVFEGWYIDEACTQKYTFTIMPDSSITVYAKFRQVQYRVFLHPLVPAEKIVDWGSDAQAMNFRGTYGTNISLPTGKLILSESTPEYLDESYEFAGWYRDPQFKKPFDPDAFVLNDDLATDYNKLTDLTDYMDKYGNINAGPNDEEPYNSDLIGNNGGDRWWIDSKIDLYAKWIKRMEEGEGIQVIYDPNGGSTEVKDDTLYKDQTSAAAQSAPVTPPTTTITHADGTTETVNKVFLYWVLQKWDATANNGEGAFVDVAPLDFVYPGDTFTVSHTNAHTVETPVIDPETNQPLFDQQGNPVTKTEHFVQLRAEYSDPEAETPTHIWWYSNFGNNEVKKLNDTKDATNVAEIRINEGVNIKPADTFTRPGYTFIGWARVESTHNGEPIQGHPTLHPELDEDDLFLKYVEAADGVAAHFEAQKPDETWATVTQVAADEVYEYHDLYAVWKPIPYTLKVIKNVTGTDADKDAQYSFTANGLSSVTGFTLYGQEKKNDQGEVTQSNSIEYTVYYSDKISIEESSAYTNFTTTILIRNGNASENKTGLKTGEITVDGDVTITFTNTRKTADVTVQKVLADPYADGTQSFTFTPTLTDDDETDLTDALGLSDGTFVLTPTEQDNVWIASRTFTGLPVGATLSVVETGNDDYTTTATVEGVATTGTTGSVTISVYDQSSETDPNLITFTNTRKVIDIYLNKVAKGTTKLLPGAEFKLYRKNSSGTYTSDETIEATKETTTLTLADGTLEVTGLTSGDYKLTETNAPTGFTIENSDIYFTVNTTGTSDVIVTTSGQQAFTEIDVSTTGTNNNTLVIPNTPGASLPSTGGSGTLIYTITGIFLITLAGALMVIRKRKNEQ